MSAVRPLRFTCIGLGNIGRNLLDILVHRREAIARDYGLEFLLVGAADSSGAALAADGLEMAQVRDLKLARQGVADYPGAGQAGMSALEMVEAVPADLLVDAAPTNLMHGERIVRNWQGQEEVCVCRPGL